MSYALNLFQSMYDNQKSIEEEIDRIESREADLKMKEKVLEQAKAIAKDDDSQYFVEELQQVIGEKKRLSELKTERLEEYRALNRRIDTIQRAVGKVETI